MDSRPADAASSEVPRAVLAAEGVGTALAEELERSLAGRTEWPLDGPGADWLSDDAQEVDAVQRLAGDLALEISRLRGIADRLAEVEAVESVSVARIDKARQWIDSVLDRSNEVLARYYRTEFEAIHAGMRALRAQCELEARRYADVRGRATAGRAQLDRRLCWAMGRVFHPRRTREKRERLAQRVADLERRSDGYMAFVGRDELIGWLDGLVEGALNLDEETWLQASCSVRVLLYELLNVHCAQDRVPAHEVSTDIILPAAREGVFDCRVETERFLETYFARRCTEPAERFYGTAAERVARLERLAEVIRQDYRERTRRAG